MLGYVVSYKPEMKVKDAELYNGYYCGVCKSIGKRYSQLSRMVLSYDAAFLALLLDSVVNSKDEPTFEHCIAHPIKKKVIVRNRSIDFAGDVMLLLAWYKLLDDAQDEGKISAKGLMVLEKRTYNKVKENTGELSANLEKELEVLNKLEKEKCDSLDKASDAFANIMKQIFIEGLKINDIDDKSTVEIFSVLGYHLGKWIYIMDAFDDIEDNAESGAYNPLIYRYKYNHDFERIEVFEKRIKEEVEFNLIMCLSQMGKALDLLDIKKNKDILENIIYVGLLNKTEEILKGEEK